MQSSSSDVKIDCRFRCNETRNVCGHPVGFFVDNPTTHSTSPPPVSVALPSGMFFALIFEHFPNG